MIYLRKPSPLYSSGEVFVVPNLYSVQGVSKMFYIRTVEPVRELERMMIKHGRNYVTGRIGAEIAYSIIREKFRIRGLILEEPAKGGKDLVQPGQDSRGAVSILGSYGTWLVVLFDQEEPQTDD